MNVKHLIDAAECLDMALTATPDTTERADIASARRHVAGILACRGVFIGNPQPDNEDAQEILRAQTRHIPFTADKYGFAVIKTATNFRVEIGAKSNPVAQAVKELIIRAVNAYKP